MRFVRWCRTPAESEYTDMALRVGDHEEHIRVRTRVVRAFLAELVPVIWRHGPVTMTFGAEGHAVADLCEGAFMTGKHSENRQRDRMVSVRFTARELEAVQTLADAEGLPVSTWLRTVAARQSERQRRKWLDEHHDQMEVIPGSGRLGTPRALPSSLSRPRTFTCPHMSIGNVVSASCGICGPLSAAA